jgi:hypothetical protein
MSASIQGESGPVKTGVEYGFDRQTGSFEQVTWEGTHDALQGILPDIGIPDSYLLSPTGTAKWRLTARYSGASTGEGGTTEVPIHEERLRFNQIQKSIFAVPAFVSVDDEIKRYIEGNADEPDDDGALRNYVELVDPALALTLWDLVSAGVKEQTIYQPVVVVTDTASANYAWNVGFTNYGRIFSTASMISDADLGASWQGNLPDETSSTSGFEFGWLKSPPEIVNAGSTRSQLVQEYTYGLWATVMYGDLL